MDYQQSRNIVKEATFEYCMNPDTEVCYDTFYDSLCGEEDGHIILPHYVRCCLVESSIGVATFCDLIEETLEQRIPSIIIQATAELCNDDDIRDVYNRFLEFLPHTVTHDDNSMCKKFGCAKKDTTDWQRSCKYIMQDCPYNIRPDHKDEEDQCLDTVVDI